MEDMGRLECSPPSFEGDIIVVESSRDVGSGSKVSDWAVLIRVMISAWTSTAALVP